MRQKRSAFTLIELLVVISIIALLLGILVPALAGARRAAVVAQELSRARQLAIGYIAHADEHSGYVLPARVDLARSPRALRDIPLDPEGKPMTGPSAERYVWRLAPYLDDNVDVLYRDRDAFDSLLGVRDFYQLSLYPAFGINERFVGGLPVYYPRDNSPDPSTRYTRSWGEGWWITRISDSERPSDLFTFVSSAYGDDDGFKHGFYRVRSPNFTTQQWASTDLPTMSSAPGDTGQVWPAVGGVVVSALLDGHAASFSWEQTLDMRNWSPNADSKDWVMPSPR